MGVMKYSKMIANMAVEPIMAGAKQAKSYASPIATLAKEAAGKVAATTTRNSLMWHAGIGAGVGAVGSAGWDRSDPNTTMRSTLKAGLYGGILGAAAGAGIRAGRSVYSLRGTETAKNLGSNFTLLGRDLRKAYGNTRSTWGSMARYYAGAGEGATTKDIASFYGNKLFNSVADTAGKAYGTVQFGVSRAQDVGRSMRSGLS